MGREVLQWLIRNEPSRWGLALLLLAAIGCRESEPGPQPRNRAEATELEKKGHSFAAKTRPAWVDEPRGAGPRPTSIPTGWSQAGRGTLLLGRMEQRRTQALAELQGEGKGLEGARVRVRAPIRGCPGERSLVVLEDSGQTLVAVLQGELPQGVGGRRAVLEGELRKPTAKEAEAASRCLGREGAVPLLLWASGALVHMPGGR